MKSKREKGVSILDFQNENLMQSSVEQAS